MVFQALKRFSTTKVRRHIFNRFLHGEWRRTRQGSLLVFQSSGWGWKVFPIPACFFLKCESQLHVHSMIYLKDAKFTKTECLFFSASVNSSWTRHLELGKYLEFLLKFERVKFITYTVCFSNPWYAYHVTPNYLHITLLFINRNAITWRRIYLAIDTIVCFLLLRNIFTTTFCLWLPLIYHICSPILHYTILSQMSCILMKLL